MKFNVIGVDLNNGETFPILFGIGVSNEEGRKLIDSYRNREYLFAYYMEPCSHKLTREQGILTFLNRCLEVKYEN